MSFLLKKGRKMAKNDQKTAKIAKFYAFLWIFWLLNIFDMLGTIFGIESGYAYEVNPVMAAAYSQGIDVFVVLKYFMVSFSLSVFAAGAKHKVIRWMLLPIILIYFLVCISHVLLFIFAKFVVGI